MITPLQCLVQLTSNVEQQLNDPNLRNKLQIVANTGELILKQVTGNLDKNLLQNNMFKPNLEQYSVQKMIQEAVNMMEIQASQKNVTIFFAHRKDLPDIVVSIDKMRCQQIIFNLLQNSIKFSSKDQIITISVEEFSIEGDRGNTGVNIRVQDDGIGIKEQDRQNLFNLYFKSSDEASRTINQASNGIGLHFCKRLAQLLGGDLTLNQEKSEGCEFIFKVVLKKIGSDTGSKYQRAKGNLFKIYEEEED